MLDDLSEFNTSLQTTISDDSYGLVYENSLTNSCASNTELVFTAQHTHAKVFSCFKQFKDEGKLIDVQLKSTSNHVNYINAHKIILSGVSPYFQAQFCGGFVDGKKNLIELDINFPILSQIVEFMYTAKILVNEVNVQNLLQSAKLLHVDDIVNACCLYLYLNMDSTNVLGIHDLAETYALKKLLQQAINYVHDHFEEIVHGPEFLGLNEHKLCQFLSCDQLKVKCESTVFNALLDWVKHDIDARRMSLEHMFQCVRFHYVPPSLLKEQIQSSELFKRSDMCKFKDCLQKTVEDLIEHRPCPYSNRKPFLKFALYVFGGYQRQSLNMVETFKLCSTMGASWEQCDNMRHARSGVACVTSSFLIFIIGGRNNTLNGNIDCADVECFDPLVNSWRMCSSMSVPRSRPSGGVIDGLVYVCGGASNSIYHSSVERYYPHLNTWESVARMHMARMGLGCCVVNRLLYAIGGYDGKNRLNQVEYYNPDQNKWYLTSSMNVARSGSGVCSLDNRIYVIGGYTNDSQLNSVETFDTLTSQWTFVSSMNTPRSAMACVSWNSRILALGGYNGKDFLSKVEVYDPNEDKWIECSKLRMSTERSGHGAAISIETN